VVRLLASFGANVNTSMNDGWTPVMIAAQRSLEGGDRVAESRGVTEGGVAERLDGAHDRPVRGTRGDRPPSVCMISCSFGVGLISQSLSPSVPGAAREVTRCRLCLTSRPRGWSIQPEALAQRVDDADGPVAHGLRPPSPRAGTSIGERSDRSRATRGTASSTQSSTSARTQQRLRRGLRCNPHELTWRSQPLRIDPDSAVGWQPRSGRGLARPSGGWHCRT
jgi:hypothetical protein